MSEYDDNSTYIPWKTNISKYESTAKISLPNSHIAMKESTSPTDLTAHHSSHSSDTQSSSAHSVHSLKPFLSPGLSALNATDMYSQIGMDRIGQIFRAGLIGNNNSPRCDDKNKKLDQQVYERGKAEQSMSNIKQLVENAIGIEAKQQIMYILEKISLLQPPERLLLYLRMPSSTSDKDPLRQPQNPLGTRSEINFTINWVKSHLEMDPNVSIPKQDVYDEYVSYCEREAMKPLSTADFGKVMKQIFPSLRPRRLGTRGNSRYCYAAMRKTTKLECPLLPNLNDRKKVFESSAGNNKPSNDDEPADSADVWDIIKTWAESILKREFRDAEHLAEHITIHQKVDVAKDADSPKWTSKKAQKKLKEPAVDTKKRRRKKLKKLPSKIQEPVGQDTSIEPDSPCMMTTNMPYIKQERKNSASSSDHVLELPSQDIVPINLTNLKCEYKLSDKESDSGEGMKPPNESLVCKIEVSEADEIDQTILCKKVKRAQESKGITVPPKIYVQASSPSPSFLMRPPQCEIQPTDLSMNHNDANIIATDLFKPDSTHLHVGVRRPVESSTLKNKRLRFNKQASVAGLNETKVDDIATDIIIPRERVVSICNMEKDALDDYLNEGGDAQEQEAELLQYFQTANSSQSFKMIDAATAKSAVVEHVTGQAASACPVLENYQLHHTGEESRPTVVASVSSALNEQHRIDELRQYLHQNLQQPVAIPATQNHGAGQMFPPNCTAHEATVGITIGHNKKPQSADNQRPNTGPIVSIGDAKRMRVAIESNSTHGLDSKYRHFSFIPISPGPKSPLSTAHTIHETHSNNQSLQNGSSIFQSPSHKSLSFPKQVNNKSNSHKTGTSNHMYTSARNDISASAPVSPSIVTNQLRFNLLNGTQLAGNIYPRASNPNQLTLCQLSQTSEQLTDPCSFETRSQSVPLFCQSSSSCVSTATINSVSNSVAQTPVPTEMADFSENGVIIDMM